MFGHALHQFSKNAYRPSDPHHAVHEIEETFSGTFGIPALDFHVEGNCGDIQNANALAEHDDQLWVVDKKWKSCPSKIWIIDIFDRLSGSDVHVLPEYINSFYTPNMDLGSMALYSANFEVHAFILDRFYQAVVVFSELKEKWWVVRLWKYHPVSGIAVSSRKYIFLSSSKSTTPALYELRIVDVLLKRQRSITPTFVANKTSSSHRLHMDRLDFLYFDVREMTGLSSWHSFYSFKEEPIYQDENQQLADNERYYSRFTTDYDRKVWLLIRFDGGFKLLTSGPVQKFDVSNKDENDY